MTITEGAKPRFALTPQRTRLSLQIRHPSRDLSGICRTLGVVPKIIWRKGDEAMTPKGNRLGRLRDNSYCTIDLGSSREPLPVRIKDALELLKPYRAMLRRLSSSGGRVSLYFGWFCEGDTGEVFDWKILDAMAELRVSLDLSIYTPEEASEAEHDSAS